MNMTPVNKHGECVSLYCLIEWHSATRGCLIKRLWHQVLARLPSSGAANAHDGLPQETERKSTSHPTHDSGIRLPSLIRKKACKSLVHCSCFSGHASTGCQHEWRECSSFHFSNALAVFIAFLRFMLFVDGCELPLAVTGRERI